MSDAASNQRRPEDRRPNRQQTAAYLEKMLRGDPRYESSELACYRAQWLAATANQSGEAARVAPVKLESPATDRQEALQTIQTVRANLWRAPIDRLHDKLDRLEIDEHPDLVRSVSRLQVVLANGPLLESVLGHPEFDADFFAVYQKLLAGAPTETGVLRERAIASFASRKLRRRGLKTISLIEQAAPALAELEQEWLATLKRQRAKLIPRRDPGKLKRSQPKKIGWKWWEVVVCAVLLGFALLRILKDIFE